jgi:hypothetical protein
MIVVAKIGLCATTAHPPIITGTALYKKEIGKCLGIGKFNTFE